MASPQRLVALFWILALVPAQAATTENAPESSSGPSGGELTEPCLKALARAKGNALESGANEITALRFLKALGVEDRGGVEKNIRLLGGEYKQLERRIDEYLEKERKTKSATPIIRQEQMRVDVRPTEEVRASPELTGVIFQAKVNSAFTKENFITVDHMMSAIATAQDVRQVFDEAGIARPNYQFVILDARQKLLAELDRQEKIKEASQVPDELKKFTTDLTEMARKGLLRRCVGRLQQMYMIMEILTKYSKNNVMLVGPAGCGKTQLVEGLVILIVERRVPVLLQGLRVLQLDSTSLIAGTSYRGQHEQRVQLWIEYCLSHGGHHTANFFDEVHTMVGAGKTEGSSDFANQVKTFLARGQSFVIAATTDEEVIKVEQDPAFCRRFRRVTLTAPGMRETEHILRGLKADYEAYHKVEIRDEAITSSVELTRRYVTSGSWPDIAIDVLDCSCALVRNQLTSLPLSLDEDTQKITQLKMELAGLENTNTDGAIKTKAGLRKELAELEASLKVRMQEYNKEKQVVDKIAQLTAEIAEKEKLFQVGSQVDGFVERNKKEFAHVSLLKEKIEELHVAAKKIRDTNGTIWLKDYVDATAVASTVHSISGVPVGRLMLDQRDKLKNLPQELMKHVVGQDKVVVAVASALRRSGMELSREDQPVANFYFTGFSGTGKSELANAVGIVMYGGKDKVIQYNGGQLGGESDTYAIIGPPAGLVGYDNQNYLTNRVAKMPYCTILIDEFDKAHSKIAALFLHLMGEGQLADNHGKRVSFSHAIIIFTGNVGADHLATLNMNDPKAFAVQFARAEKKVKADVAAMLAPEFIQRLTGLFVFKPLSREDMRAIMRKRLDGLKDRISVKHGVGLAFRNDAVDLMIDLAGSPQNGARYCQSWIEIEIVGKLAKYLCCDQLRSKYIAQFRRNRAKKELMDLIMCMPIGGEVKGERCRPGTLSMVSWKPLPAEKAYVP